MNIIAHEMSLSQAITIWPTAEEYLREAIIDEDKDNFLRSLKAKVFAGICTLWELRDEFEEVLAYVITVLYSNDGKVKIAQLYMATTKDMQIFVEQMDQFESWARTSGVDLMEIVGRKGWERVLKPYGFTHNFTSLVKAVTKELH